MQEEFLKLFPKTTHERVGTKFIANSTTYCKPYWVLLEFCKKHGIILNSDNPKETVYKIYHNKFKSECIKCNKETKFVNYARGYRLYCSTKCSAQDRDNSTRKGFNIEEGRIKAIKTIEHKYGVSHQMHIVDSFERTQNKRYKTYTLLSPNKIEYKVQGYERYVVPYLWNLYGEDDVVVKKSEIPKIFYEDDFGKIRKYYPDCYIKSTNTLIEVKSTYTMKNNCLKSKMRACPKNNFNVKVILWDKGFITEYNYEQLFDYSSSSISSSTP